jgi:hypothetical protein
LGPKEEVRELFLGACERILGAAVPRRGPTEVAIDPSFQYEVGFIGHRWAVESLSLGIQPRDGDPHRDPKHPVWAFLKGVAEHTGWEAFDAFTGEAIDFNR